MTVTTLIAITMSIIMGLTSIFVSQTPEEEKQRTEQMAKERRDEQ